MTDHERKRFRRIMRLHDDAMKVHHAMSADLRGVDGRDPRHAYFAMSSIQRQAVCNFAVEHGRAAWRAKRASQIDKIRKMRKVQSLKNGAWWVSGFLYQLTITAAFYYFAYRGLLAVYGEG